MALRVDIHSDARAEAAAATEWYRAEAGEDVALRFTARVRDALQVTAEWPRRAPVRADGSRALRVDDFPYVVLYDLHDDHVLVLAFAHTSREPGYWRDRR